MPLVDVDELHKRFGETRVLRGVTLSVEEGEVVAIIGRSGSGKSTLLRILNGLETFDAGFIMIDGGRISGMESDLRPLRLKVGMVFQQFNLFPHLADKFDAYPDQLSGGQQQRVAIARALAMRPKVLLCDEITSALDPELVGEVLEVVQRLASEGMTLIMVTHEMRFAREVGDTLVFMHQGRIHEAGDPKELFANPRTPELAAFIRSVA